MRKALTLILATSSTIALNAAHAQAAGYIASNVTITAVSNTANNGQHFTIRTAGGSGVCAGQKITFPLADAGTASNNQEIHNRAFALALAAMLSGKHVSVYNYADDTCSHAAYIEIFQ